MFGKNQIVGQKFFDNSKGKFLVTTIFGPTIQGEGPLAGTVSMFIRLAKCNLACSFCDTYFDTGEWMTNGEILAKLGQRYTDHYTVEGWDLKPGSPVLEDMACIITGGEPSLQHLSPLCLDLHKFFRFVQIESNGIIYPRIPDKTILVVSPKCMEKEGKAVKYLAPNNQVLQRADALKFVIEEDPNSPYYTIPEWAFEWRKGKSDRYQREIYISPMNMYNSEPKDARAALVGKNELTLDERSVVNEVISFWEPGLLDMEKNQANHQYAAKFCIDHGCRLSLQQHLYVSMA